MEERRHYVRANGLVLVNYKIPEVNLEGKSSAFDISGSGVRITLEKKIKNDSLVEMEIYLPGSSQPIPAKGQVSWSARCPEKTKPPMAEDKSYFYAGVRFTVIDEGNRIRISEYVHRKTHSESEKKDS